MRNLFGLSIVSPLLHLLLCCCASIEGRGIPDRGQKRPVSPYRSFSALKAPPRSRAHSISSSEHSRAVSDTEDRNPSDAESVSSKDSVAVRTSFKYVSEGKWVKSQWLSARCLGEIQSEVSPNDSGPSKDLAFGKMSSEWNRISTNRLRRKWAHPIGAPSFAAPKADNSLAAAFENVKTKSKASFNLMETTIQSTGAAAHAILSAQAFTQCFLAEIPRHPPSSEEWSVWRSHVRDSFKTGVLAPMSEATTCLASVSNGCVKDVRRMILACPQAKPLKSALKDSKPSATHYFGNETDKVNSAISSAYMLKSLDDKQSRKFTPFHKKGGFQSSRSSTSAGHSKNFSANKNSKFTRKAPNRGNSSSRPPRGKGAGKE